jgi:hypothetical protein
MVSIPNELTKYRLDLMRGVVAPRMLYYIAVLAMFSKQDPQDLHLQPSQQETSR